MKKIISILVFLLCLVCTADAQNFAPGEQAQGLLESKHVTVDYATGIFHYSIPLCTLRSGEFELPITVQHTGRGVRQGEQPGLLGYNWTLYTGGVVTRTVRGGIADEDPSAGLLWAPRPSIEAVNLRQYDGESDIFTASFNGRSVRFIIRHDAYGFHALPLEKTLVRIECETFSDQMDGWVVTDEEGNRYVYRQKEWTSDVFKEDAVSFNGVRGKSYVSSWYLSRIEPQNGEPIDYVYLEEVKPHGEQSSIQTTDYYYWYDSRYEYGKPMQERPVDFSAYRKEFNEALSLAREYIGAYSLEAQLSGFASDLTTATDWIRNPVFGADVALVEQNTRVLGIMGNLKGVSHVSNGLIALLNELIDTYGNASSVNAQMAGNCFAAAKGCVMRCLQEVRSVSTKVVRNGTEYTVRSPLLSRIKSADRTVELMYDTSSSRKRLISVSELSRPYSLVSSAYFESDYRHNLSRVRLHGHGHSGQIDFSYYFCPEGHHGYDHAGYPTLLASAGERFPAGVSEEAVKSTYLKEISLLHGGSVTLDYELNMGRMGLRLKSLVLKEGSASVHCDTITYQYISGASVNDHLLRTDAVDYAGFSDRVTNSRILSDGILSCLAEGNNGIYYSYVIEHLHGKGSRAYRFHVPSRNPEGKILPYAYWLYGLPLATASYDETGRLRELVKNAYYTDMDFDEADKKWIVGENAPYFAAAVFAQYGKSLPQIHAYKYYLDKQAMEEYYRQQGSILLYSDGSVSYSVSPYEEIYLPDIEPRTCMELPEQSYKLRFGGATLLKEQSVYRFGTDGPRGISYADADTFATGVPYLKTEYVYDNPLSAYPTRIVRSGSEGEAVTTVIRRVADRMACTDSMTVRMRRRNLLSPVVKQQIWEGGRLCEENVSVYQVVETDSACYAGLSEYYGYVPENPDAIPSTVSDTALFGYGKEHYVLKQSGEYRVAGHSFPLIRSTEREKEVSLCHGKLLLPLLRAEGTSPSAIAAGDVRPDERSILSEESSFSSAKGIILPRAVRFCMELDRLDMREVPKEYLEYFVTPEHMMLVDIIRMLAHPETPPERSLSDILSTLASYRENGDEKGVRFEQTYLRLSEDVPSFTMPYPEVSTLVSQVIGIGNQSFLGYYFQLEGAGYTTVYDTLSVSGIPASGRLRLYVASRYASVPVRYRIFHAGGIATGEAVTSASVSGYGLDSFELDLSGYAGVTSFQLEHPKKAFFVAVVPDGVPFEALSYNPDGTVFMRFREDGRMEVYDYDSCGCLTSVRDTENRLLKRMENNTVVKR